MNGHNSEISTQIQGKPCEYVDLDDDVFLNQLPEADVYSDIPAQMNKKYETVEEVKRALANQGTRTRRASDVIDSLGEDIVAMRKPGSALLYESVSVPVSPRSRTSLDLGYSDSIPSSPANHFTFGNIQTIQERPSATIDSVPFKSAVVQGYNEPENADMPVCRDADEYNMSHRRRGYAVIINNEVFDNDIVPERKGTQIDVDLLEDTYKSLGFQVQILQNLTHHEIQEALVNLSKADHTDADCIVFTVMTHGMDGGFLFARDTLYRVQLLWSMFTADKCLTLAGKPKLFFIQACRGQKQDSGVCLTSNRRSISETDSGSSQYTIPSHGDFLMAFSTSDGYYSWRSPDEGTWFIQSLALELRLHGKKKHLVDILTRVNRRVALQFQSNVPDNIWMNNQKQCPIYHSSLMRDLYFRDK